MIGLQETLIVITHHIDINIIIPRDIPLMADSTDEGTATERIAQTLFLTKAMDIIHNPHLDIPQLLNIRNLPHISFSFLTFDFRP